MVAIIPILSTDLLIFWSGVSARWSQWVFRKYLLAHSFAPVKGVVDGSGENGLVAFMHFVQIQALL